MSAQDKVSKSRKILLKLFYLFAFIAFTFILIFISALSFGVHKGLPEADAFIGVVYKTGLVVIPADTVKAKKYLSRAAAKNNAMSQCELGELYEQEGDYQTSAYWYLQSSLNGRWQCNHHFEKFNFTNKHGLFIIFKSKADSQNAFAQYLVGKSYIEGSGVDKDINAGINYLKKSALSGGRGAQIYLAGLYIKGEVVRQDLSEANKWLDAIEK